jgi:hypothetical protein
MFTAHGTASYGLSPTVDAAFLMASEATDTACEATAAVWRQAIDTKNSPLQVIDDGGMSPAGDLPPTAVLEGMQPMSSVSHEQARSRTIE